MNMPPTRSPRTPRIPASSRTLNGNASTASEFRFQESEAGQEEVHLHAEHDFFASAENNRIETVGNQHHLNVGKGLYIGVGGGASSGSGSGGGTTQTKDILGIEFDIGNSKWTQTYGSMKSLSLGNTLAEYVGAVENIYVGNYTKLVGLSRINMTIGLNYNHTTGVNVRPFAGDKSGFGPPGHAVFHRRARPCGQGDYTTVVGGLSTLEGDGRVHRERGAGTHLPR